MDLQKITRMLYKYPHPVAITHDETFLEIAGYPQLENVASNILEFFFKTQGEHRFKSLFLEALLETAGLIFTPTDLDVESVQREVYTKTNTRLDLVIGTPTLLIGIENKLFHQLNNDFNIYAQHLHTQAKECKVICILLSLYPVAPSPSLGGFIPITYAAFFNNIRKHMGRFVVEANQRYIPFLFDFMQTVEHFRQEETMSDHKFRAWVTENQNEIKGLLDEVNRLKDSLRKKVKNLRSIIDVAKYQNSGLKFVPNLWAPDHLLVSDHLFYESVISDNMKFAVDIVVNPNNWEIYVVSRNPTTIEALETFLSNIQTNTFERTRPDRVCFVEKFDYDVDLAIVATRVQRLIDCIAATQLKP